MKVHETDQTFGSALTHPWALMIFGSNAPEGRRPGTSVVYLTDDEGDHYLGGEVHYSRRYGRWLYRYLHAKRIPKDKVLHVFPLTTKNAYGGPPLAMIARARAALPITRTTTDDSV
jgi:hypothetical protein